MLRKTYRRYRGRFSMIASWQSGIFFMKEQNVYERSRWISNTTTRQVRSNRFSAGSGYMGMSGMYGYSDEAERIATIHEAIATRNIQLSPEELATIEVSIQESAVAGARYDEHQMQMLDSEK
jgi:hypothetical protein